MNRDLGIVLDALVELKVGSTVIYNGKPRRVEAVLEKGICGQDGEPFCKVSLEGMGMFQSVGFTVTTSMVENGFLVNVYDIGNRANMN